MKNKLPDRILRRKKRGFSVPVNIWMKRDLIDDLVEQQARYNIPVLRSNFFDKAVKRIRASQSDYYSNYFYSSYLWSYYVFDKWVDENLPEVKI